MAATPKQQGQTAIAVRLQMLRQQPIQNVAPSQMMFVNVGSYLPSLFKLHYNIVATRCHIIRLKCNKFDFGPQIPLGELTVLLQNASWI